MTLVFCSDLSAADWLVRSDLPWQQLVGFGPAGFEAYARLRLLPDPTDAGASEADVEAHGRVGQMELLLDVLAGRTTTPGECYFCVWDGYGDSGHGPFDDAVYVDDGVFPESWADEGARPGFSSLPVPPWGSAEAEELPRVVLPHRAYWLFRGTLDGVGRWDSAEGRPDAVRLGEAEPAFVWPADRAWCVAQDVDPHWAGIGASRSSIDLLTADPRLDVVPADPSQEQPSYD